MNLLEFLKNGSRIHIKPSKRGSFTRWCGGNVTEECIRRGKNSPNAAIRKKATFADNARHFKHRLGGRFLQGGTIDLFINAIVLTLAANSQIDAKEGTNNANIDKDFLLAVQNLQEFSKEKLKKYHFNWINNFKNGLTLENMSPDVLEHFGQNQIGLSLGNLKYTRAREKKANSDAATSEKAANYALLFGTLANTGFLIYNLYKQNSSQTPIQLPVQPLLYNTPNLKFNTDSFWSNPSLSQLFN